MSAQPAPDLTVEEAAAKLGCDASTIRRRVRAGELAARRVGARLYLLDAASVAKATRRDPGRPPKREA